MRLGLTLALTGSAVVLAVMVGIGMRGRGTLIGVALLGIPGLLLASQEVAAGTLESRLEAVTFALAGTPATVDCERFSASWIDTRSEWGYVPWDADGRPKGIVRMDYEACRHLADYIASDKVGPSLEQVAAVHVVAHEAFHIAGITNEADAECRAVQRNREVATRLGATAAQAEVLSQRYWREVYPGLRDPYRSAECRDGGAMDLAPTTPGWP